MKSFNDYVNVYREQLAIGDVKIAYKHLLEFLVLLRGHFANKYPKDYICGHVYQGYMDMSFFTFTPEALRNRKLKITVIFNHEKICFEIWLTGQSKQIQDEYWQMLKKKRQRKYKLPAKPDRFILEKMLVEEPNFNNLETLTEEIDENVMKFVVDMSEMLLPKPKHRNFR
ncbi:hypothetical protein [Dysgonomonas sp. 520]|uniref:DUF7000 family protein n=1 Tax=Dysgonomonas sp. 520 TaxID=2302931 RepID=UPI0013D4D347|nr:hypothetical protein [Dysgonomonas sp. 520]NDW08526.1 hypothetical protein [Dysgonomonas sp. 520]